METPAPQHDSLAAWQQLMSPECEDLRARAAACDAYSTADVTALRKKWDKDLVHAALALAKARTKAVHKFGDAAATLVADPEGVEMATSRAAATWKSRRFAAAATGEGGGVVDLCCGIGGDAMALRAAGLRVLCVDSDPVRAWMAQRNTGFASRCETVESMLANDSGPSGDLFHIDPSRRMKDGSGSRRVWSLADVQPPPSVLRELTQNFLGGAIKLAPGVDFAELALAGLEGEVEIISERGGLTQAVLWTGRLSRGDRLRTATLLRCAAHETADDGQVATISGEVDTLNSIPVWPASAPAPKYIFDVDDSVERAELLTELCRTVGASMLHPRLGLLASDAVIHNPFLRGFELLETARWNEQRAAAVLQRLGAGSVEVKTRAKAINPDQVQPLLNKACVKGGVPLVVFVMRFGSEARMLIARRLETPNVPR